MRHPAIENETPFALLSSFPSDEDGRLLFVPLIQATYAIAGGQRLERLDPQPAPRPEGVLHGEGAATASYRVEPPFAFTKLATDVVLCGTARAPRPVPWIDVTLRVGAIGKTVRVFGDRVWTRSLGGVGASAPRPFEEMPLVYERAFGGWDRSHPDPSRHAVERRNPAGVGFCAPGRAFEDGVSLPNLEDPADPLLRWGQIAAPAGFGFVSPDWEPRASLGGSYDEAWRRERMPLLPGDFDRRFFNAASPGLIAPGYLRGDEQVTVTHATPGGSLSFRLPGAQAITCRATTRRRDATFPLELDTIIVDTDEGTLALWYRGHLALRDGPHDLLTAENHRRAADREATAGPATKEGA